MLQARVIRKALDPKVRAMLADIDKESAKKMKEQSEPKPIPPPETFEEFLKYQKLKDWPEPVLLEEDSSKAARALVLGTQDDIEGILRDAAPLPLAMLSKLDERLIKLENVLMSYAEMIIKDEDADDKLFPSSSKAFMTETGEIEGRSVLSKMSSKSPNRQGDVDHLREKKKKSIENGTFPGFRRRELIELPNQIEVPPLLHRITKAQDFNPGFRKFWKKIFLSEASVAVMQDTFWWIFLHKFKKGRERKKDMDFLFDRIADSFVALFHSIHTDVKDKFLMAYPNCLAQALFVAFCEAYPESKAQFDCDCFKQDVIDLVFEWTSGIKVLPGLHHKWDVQRLLRKGGLEQDTAEAAKQMLENKNSTDKKKAKRHSMDLTGFEKMVNRLGEPLFGEIGGTTTMFSREGTQLTTTTGAGQAPQGLTVGQSQLTSLNIVPGLDEDESHQIGPGADIERVKFNLQGRSPLVAHYLHKRQLQSFQQAGKKVRRTEVAALPPPGLTYREVINNTLSLSENLNQEYQKICDRTNQEIMDLEKRKKETNREIDKLQRELLFTKNSVELKILSEKILEMKDRDKNKSFFATDSSGTQAVVYESDESGGAEF